MNRMNIESETLYFKHDGKKFPRSHFIIQPKSCAALKFSMRKKTRRHRETARIILLPYTTTNAQTFNE